MCAWQDYAKNLRENCSAVKPFAYTVHPALPRHPQVHLPEGPFLLQTTGKWTFISPGRNPSPTHWYQPYPRIPFFPIFTPQLMGSLGQTLQQNISQAKLEYHCFSLRTVQGKCSKFSAFWDSLGSVIYIPALFLFFLGDLTGNPCLRR